MDFTVGQDQIALSRAGFGLAGTGSLAQAGVRFLQGTVATGAGPAVIFDNATDALYFDPDGASGAAQILLAQLQLPSPASLQASDFLVVWCKVLSTAAVWQLHAHGDGVPFRVERMAPHARPVPSPLVGEG